YDRGAVADLTLRGDLLEGAVEGSEYAPYRVRVSFDTGGITSATCSCPYDFGGWCKHIIALLLAALHDRDAIESRPPLDALLADLDRTQLQALLIGLAERDADLANAIERQVGLLQLASAAPSSAAISPQAHQAGASIRRSAIDQAAIRQQVRLVMRSADRDHSGDRYYDDESDPSDQAIAGVRPLLEQARGFVEGGDARSALDILSALNDEYLPGYQALVDHWEDVYGYDMSEGPAGEFFGELAELWAEAILSADLGEDERDEWGEKLIEWNDQAQDSGAGTPFDLAVAAVEQGWDYPPLRRVLAGDITEKGAWEGESPYYSGELALARLRVLKRQGRHQEYVYLAKAEGQLELYVVMLATMGQARAALDESIKYLTRPQDLFAVAKELREGGELESALQVAEHGLALQPRPVADGYNNYYVEHDKAALAAWTTELAAGMGLRDRALDAAETAFRVAPSLVSYLKAHELAGEQWDALRLKLLGQLRQSRAADAKVDVFLHEQLIDDAIAAVKDGYGYGLLERVMDAAIATRPEWVIEAARTQAERIMSAGDAKHYDDAVGWLRRARDAYRAAGQPADWQSYLGSIKTTHGRKHKLMGLLRGL
ncbi:MAG: SWIM zinc finger family protein, partial [Chloroflexota bacterium]|nr:SWIM zinc finger family protein [Chloroflexota bacterium]